MFHIMVLLKVKNPRDIDTVATLLAQVSAVTLEEESCCKKLDVYHSQVDPNLFVLVEQWDKKEDWEAHRNERAFKEIYQPQVLPLVEREPHISELISTPRSL
ncbi:Quinol monooxygenase YgiN [Desulfuromusa kysingii]|uniref:Quinol monooxygenase YgiN n=1 Tax=Desulfuromusa kysingii TaxID=37625 RepID=A0A1H3YDD5_9BACT|nr:antibiotic biosynthesis monooxygenase [Desulfuromusa kysingii]SEA08908.1 Quinol monooxygenase YgiN [Desulfuromusa kysingii]